MLDRRLDPAKRGAIDTDDKELIRQLRFQRVRAATITADRLEREVTESAGSISLAEHKGEFTEVVEIKKNMTK